MNKKNMKLHTIEDALADMRAIAGDNALRYRIENYYTTQFRCLNCGFHDPVEIKKGTPVRNFSCPKCACKPCEVE